LTFVLPNIAFLGIVREGGRMRFKVRLAGSEIDAYTGPMTGRFIDEAVPAKFSEKWSMPWIQAIESRRVLRTVGRVEYRDRAYYISETLCAPLATDGEHPDILMVAVYYHVADGNVASDTTVAQCLTRDLAAVS
jgi:hypothetical protein